MSRKGRARIRCTCGVELGVLGSRGLEVLPGVKGIAIRADGAVFLICRGCNAPRRFRAGIAVVKAAA